MYPTVLVDSDGFALLVFTASLNTGKDCMFVGCNDSYLIFPDVGEYSYKINNLTGSAVHFILQDPEGKIINAPNYILGHQSVNIDSHTVYGKALNFKYDNCLVKDSNVELKPFKLTMFSISGEWRHTREIRERLTNGIDVIDGHSSIVSNDTILCSNIGRLDLLRDQTQVTTEVEDNNIDYNKFSTLEFFQVYNNKVNFITTSRRENTPVYIENKCCICLEELVNNKCTFIQCGHTCLHEHCYLNEQKEPRFIICPLCRGDIMATVVM